ncbi:unnamed protein product [Menidia menidia]|uniref:(Atlantic silverside) hypothetical protein n=1 Tax=Menidia menidia TaxID=238744 RepID=A0A8S4AVU9_9TELE|nr:unnamed protein product [Menidia menidia]
MTVTRFSLVPYGCFVILIWGCTTVVCLVNEGATVQPVTVHGYHSTAHVKTYATGSTDMPIACGMTSDKCMALCSYCLQSFSGSQMACLSVLLHPICQTRFENEMALLNNTDWCIWAKVSSLYSNLSLCTEDLSDCLQIPWPNPLVEEIFVDIHSNFFKDCPTEEFSDPPPPIVFALVFIPICLIPVMVSLVVLKTKNGDGSS